MNGRVSSLHVSPVLKSYKQCCDLFQICVLDITFIRLGCVPISSRFQIAVLIEILVFLFS